jgi:hypothetical protein
MERGDPVGAAQDMTERQGGRRENHEQYMWRRVIALEHRDCGEERESTSSDIE